MAHLVLHGFEDEVVLDDLFVFVAIEVFFFENLGDELVDVPLSDLLFEVAELVVH